MEAIDPELSMLNTGEFRVKYTTSRDTYDQLRTDPEIAKHVDKINKIFKELPRWVQRSTYYWEDPIK